MKHLVLTVTTLLVIATLQAQSLPDIAPKAVTPVPYQAKLLPGGAVEVSLGTQTYTILGDFSLRPGWAKLAATETEGFTSVNVNGDSLAASAPGFELKRTLSRAVECLVVTDLITNTGTENLPLMYRQYVNLPKVKEYRLCGNRIYSKRAAGTNSINSTVMVVPEEGGSLTLLAVSDIFRVHIKTFSAKGLYGLADEILVVKPGATVEMSFAIFPSTSSDYYDAVNAMRRFKDVNYVIAKGFAFLAPYPPGVKTFNPDYDRIGKDDTVEEIRRWLDCKSADYVGCGSVGSLNERAHGTAFLKNIKTDIHKAFHQKILDARPTATVFHYFHAHLDVKADMEQGTYDQWKQLKPDGTQGDYRNPALPLFIAVDGTNWTDYQEKRLKFIHEVLNCNGIFWDEFPYSALEFHYGEPWDGVTGDINPRTHEITRLKSSVALLSLSWRAKMLEWMGANNIMLIANGGGPYTKSMTDIFRKYKFIAFEETGSLSNLTQVHLFTPIGLGDHITERNELDCYRNMLRHLDFGCLYYYYHQQVEPFTHYTLSRYMFPTTPIELHEGYIIAKERILTNRSGNFSFGGNEEAEAHFFDANGYEVKREAPKFQKDGKTYYKVELGEYESCALVKKEAK
ncbi:MAG: hypothetical protein IKP00_02955 [Victivallales bacterium]|nr:hypothetical protein [Victivallales bacterium]